MTHDTKSSIAIAHMYSRTQLLDMAISGEIPTIPKLKPSEPVGQPVAVEADATNPEHYKSHPSGIEAITITEHMGFNLGNAMKYIWRCDLKQDAIEDLKKALWYIDREIKRRERQ